MTGINRKRTIMIIICFLVIASAVGFSMYRDSLTDILDKDAFKTLHKDIKEKAESGAFTSQDALTSYITGWADSNNIEYTVDKSGNIIFRKDASERKKNISPTVVCVSFNYETAEDNAWLLAGAAMIAQADITSGRRTVIFFNDEQNNGSGYRSVNKKYLKGKPKIIYLDYGNSSYISNSSFCRNNSSIVIKAGRYEPECDTAVKVSITGLESGIIGPGITKHPDPVSALGTLLARLKSKSAIYQLADFVVGTNGNMYPVSMNATIMLNSYAVPSFTKYIDKLIKAWEKAYGKDYENLSYTYEVIDDPEQLPEESYSRKASAKLTNVLYTLKNGIYKFGDTGTTVPEGKTPEDTCAINAITGMHSEDDAICVDLMTQAYDDSYLDLIMSDNTAAAELFECSIRENLYVPRFLNEKDSLQRTINSTYYKLNRDSAAGGSLQVTTDSYFTPCSYLAQINDKADIVHIRYNSDNAAAMINTILCYMAFKGNKFLL